MTARPKNRALWLRRHVFVSRRRTAVVVAAAILLPMIIVQLVYPDDTLLPGTTLDTIQLGAVAKTEAVTRLNDAYADTKQPIYFSDSDEVVIAPRLAELGVTVHNEQRIRDYSYPFMWRLVPSSLFWYSAVADKGEPTVTRSADTLAGYITEHFGDECRFAPVNATITYADGDLQVLDATRGGNCTVTELREKLQNIAARLNPEKITVQGTTTAPEVSTETARKELTRLKHYLTEDGLSLKVENTDETIPLSTIGPWLEYHSEDGVMKPSLSIEKAGEWLRGTYGKRFTSEPGTTTITTRDYAEVSRETGKSGQALNVEATIAALIGRLTGKAEAAALAIDTVPPKIAYKRSYGSTDAGLGAVMKNYADTHPGTYGIKLVELSGARRHAEYNAGAQFVTASTYKLFVAYSVLLRIESGEWQWSDPIYGGRDASYCFDIMIKLSDNDCARAFLVKATRAGVTADAQAIGARGTTFMGVDIYSTASDEALFLSLLYSGQILSQQSSRDKLITAMKANVYRQGIPKGIPGATVADKVGFLDGFLHDAAIVYSPTGNYVLIILTENSSWANIAELARELEAVRNG